MSINYPQGMAQNYTVHVSCPERGIEVFAPVPETFMHDVSSSYDTPFSNLLSGRIATMMRMGGVLPIMQAMTAKFWMGQSDTELGLDLVFQCETDARRDVMEPVILLNKLAAAHKDPNTQTLEAPGSQLGGYVWQYVKDRVEQARKAKADGPNPNEPGASETAKDATLEDGSKSSKDGDDQPAQNSADGTLIGTVEWAKRYVKNPVSLQIGQYAYYDLIVVNSVTQTFSSQFDQDGWPMHATVSMRFSPLFMLTDDDIEQVFAGGGPQRYGTAGDVVTIGAADGN